MGRYSERPAGTLRQLHQELLLLDASQAPEANQQKPPQRPSL